MTGPRGLSVVGVSGTLHSPSKTDRLLAAILAAVAERFDASGEQIETSVVSVLEHGHAIVDALSAPPSAELQAAYHLVLGADAVVVATPVYKGSYTGLLKAFFDPFDQIAFADRPVLVAALGGDAQHTLVIEHELTPLFAFFGAAVIPRGVYARGADFVGDEVAPRLQDLIDAAADRLAAAIRP